MLKILLVNLLLFTFFAAKCEVVKDSLLIDKHYRTFYFNSPAGSLKSPSLIFAMHGSGGNAADFLKNASKLDKTSGQENFILVFPQGYKNYWNECRKASVAAANVENIDEIKFFTAMIEYFKTKYQINEKHVFACGFSGGGQMAYKMGITMPKTFKAISAMVANLPTPENMDCAEARLPIATLIINGTADQTNPYQGGEMKAGVTLGYVRSTDESLSYWAKLAGYTGEPVRGVLHDDLPDNDIIVQSYTYKEPKKPEVTLYKVVNGKHEFTKDIDMFLETWAFFKRQM